ncbi:MAG: hypothetical protein ABI622_08600 [Chloroflexota bacterium]
MQQEPDQRAEPEPPRDLGHARREPDALSIALAAFFVGLIVIVAILLAVPMLTR